MNRFEAMAVAAIAGLAELVALGLFGASFTIWVAVLSGRLP